MKKKTQMAAAILIIAAAAAFVGCAGTDSAPEQAADEIIDETDESADIEAEAGDAEDVAADEAETGDAEDEAADEAEPAEDTEDEAGEGGSLFCYDTTTLDGDPVNTQDIFAGNKITMVNLWASWCGPCVGEIPELGKMSVQLEEKDCGIVGMLIDGEDPQGLSDARDILSEASADYTNVVCPESIPRELDIVGVPTTYFVDSKGNIIGEPVIGADPEAYLETVDSLLSSM